MPQQSQQGGRCFYRLPMTRMLRSHLQGGRVWITQSKQKLTDSCEKVTMIVPSNRRIHHSVYLLYSHITKRDVTAWSLTLGFLLSNSFGDPAWIVWSGIHMQIICLMSWITYDKIAEKMYIFRFTPRLLSCCRIENYFYYFDFSKYRFRQNKHLLM